MADQGSFNYAGGPQQVNGALHVYLGNANGTFTRSGDAHDVGDELHRGRARRLEQ